MRPVSAGSLRWGSYEGEMSWKEAQKACANRGMRLPTKDELLAGFDSRSETLRSPSLWYWSSTPFDESKVYIMYMYNGSTANDSHGYRYHVRCVT